MGNSSVGEKPSKPYSDFPLYAHNSGRWAKKIRGRTHFFGKWDCWKSALNRYLDERDAIQAGRNPRKQQTNDPTLQELVNVYCDDCRKRVDANELTGRTLNDYTKSLKRLATIRSKFEQPSQWTPEDFADIKESFAKPIKRTSAIRGGIKGSQVKRRSATTVDIDIRAVKAFLSWCSASEFIPAPRYGKSFRQSSEKQKRLKKEIAGPRDIAASDVLAIVGKSSSCFKAIVLLGINGAFGAKDLAEVTIEDYQGEWLNYARRKTGFARKVWLWPETRAAIDRCLAKRSRSEGTQLLFVTKQGLPWMRGSHDAIGKNFLRVRSRAGVADGTFYDLRRTFQTVAEECLDFPAVSHVMGHAAGSSDMSAKYRQRITDERIKRACEFVRTWLYGVQS